MKDEEINLEEIEASHTLGGYRRCRCYSALGQDVYDIRKMFSKHLPNYVWFRDVRFRTRIPKSTVVRGPGPA